MPQSWEVPIFGDDPKNGLSLEFRRHENGFARSSGLWDSGQQKPLIFFGGLADLEHAEEGLLRDLHAADALHAAFAFLLFSTSLRLRLMSPP